MEDFNVLEHISKLCKDYGWSYYRLSREADIPYSTITNMMKRRTVPSVPTLERICFAFGITISEFFSESSVEEEAAQRDSKRLLRYWFKLSESDRELLLTLAKRLSSKK